MIGFALLLGILITIVWVILTRPTISETRKQKHGLPDLLLYSSLVSEQGNILLNKDGSFTAAWSYNGPDLASATHEEMAVLSGRLSSMLQLGSGWMLHCDAIRRKTPEYANGGAFPDDITALIDTERRQQFTFDGSHFESEYVLALSFLPPSRKVSKMQDFVFEGGEGKGKGAAAIALETFRKRVESFDSIFKTAFNARRLGTVEKTDDAGFTTKNNDLLRYVRRCIIGEDFPFAEPETPVFLHDVIGCRWFVGGVAPKIGNKHLRCVAIEGFPKVSTPGCLSKLDTLSFEYRWNTRAIFEDSIESQQRIEKIYKKWQSKTRGLLDVMFNLGGRVNEFPARMANEAKAAKAVAEAGDVQFCIYSCNIVISDEDVDLADEHANQVVNILQNAGYAARVEDLNAIEAWRGTLPADGYRNVRRSLLHTLNLADCLPISSIWPGREFNPSSLMPTNTPPLLYATAVGATPFRFHLHYQDIGHTLILGPTGAGKSTLLNLVEAQWFRYQNAQVYVFDKGYSSWLLNKAVGGRYYDIMGEGSTINFCPLKDIDSAADRAWAISYIEDLCRMAGMEITPKHRNEISDGVELLRESPDRTLTELLANIQDNEIRAALKYYTLAGPLKGLLDAKRSEDALGTARFVTFEMEHLLAFGDDKAKNAVLVFLFRHIERSLDGRPTLLVGDEAWDLFNHPVPEARLRSGLLTFRKKNCAVVLATQQPSHVLNSAIRDDVLNSCFTKIYLPNVEAGSENIRKLYEMCGMNAREIGIIQSSTPKKQYYVTSPDGRRLVSLSLGPVTLSWIGVNDRECRKTIAEIAERNPDGWQAEWLRLRGQYEWAAYFEKNRKFTTAA